MATVAEQFRQAREAAGLTVKQVADATKMRADHIRALEEGNYECFVAPVYIRGSARTYARLLRMNEAPVLTALETELGQTTRFRDHPSLTGEHRGALDQVMLVFSRIHWRIVLPLVGVVAVLVVALVVERTVQQRRARDPLAGIGPGRYEPKTPSRGETLPLPTNSPARR